MVASTKRHPSQMKATALCSRDGDLFACDFSGDFNTGAYSSWADGSEPGADPRQRAVSGAERSRLDALRARDRAPSGRRLDASVGLRQCLDRLRPADTDLGDGLVTVAVGDLSASEIEAALAAGAAFAERLRQRGLIAAAALSLSGQARIVRSR